MKRNIFLFIAGIIGMVSCTKTTSTVTTTVNTMPKDGDGNMYDTIVIGTQVWLLENLHTTHYNDGSAIPLETDSAAWTNLTTPAYCYYNNDSASNAEYGKLYNWYAVNSGKLAPHGYHVPTDTEWTILLNYLGGDTLALAAIRETGTAHWNAPNTGATNSSGMTILPAGNHNGSNGPSFAGLHGYTELWSSTEYSANDAWIRNVQATHAKVDKYHYPKDFGFSVRCIRD